MINQIPESKLLKILTVLVVLTVLARCFAIIKSPLELSADEAQYWLWSNHLSWGYFSKPPLIAWLISFSNHVLGVSVFSIRILAPIFHGITTIFIFYLAKEVSNKSQLTQFLSALTWLTLPIIGVGSFLMSTDTPLMLLWTIGLLSIFNAYKSEKHSTWLISGLISGISIYAKYAAFYMPLGLFLFYFMTYQSNSKIKFIHLFIFFSAFLLVSIPNLIWNMFNNFSTINHLSSNAVIDSPSYSLSGSLDFIFSQLGVIGPIMFFVSILGIWKTLKLKDNFGLLIWFVLPVFIIMSIQGFFSEANANWSATALPGLSIICGHYLAKNFKVAFFAIFTNSLICLLIYLISLTGNLIFFELKSDPLRKLKGWQALSQDILDNTSKEKSDIILVERRGIAAELMYYLRDKSLKIRVPNNLKPANNHYELNYSFDEKESTKFYYITETDILPMKMKENYKIEKISISKTKISNNKYRILHFYFLEK